MVLSRVSVIAILVALILGTSLMGCARSDQDSSAVRDAYTLLDHSQNAKAIALLEAELEKNPDNDEARLLVATAYAGLAGIDFYSIYENFQDVLFRRSLRDTVLDPKAEKKKKGGMNSEPIVPAAAKNSVEKSIYLLDRSLQSLHSFVIVLNRFPQVSEEKWPYVDHALDHLGKIAPSADLSVYRVFLRLTYLKSYLVVNLIDDSKIGTHEWACSLNIEKVVHNLSFFEEHLNGISADLNLAVRMGAKRLEKVRAGIREFESDPELHGVLNEIEVGAVAHEIENGIKARFECDPT